MATWKISAKYKKSTVEKEYFAKDGKFICVETGWRGGSFTITTEGDDPPDIDLLNEDDLNIYDAYVDGVESIELDHTYDGCWTDYEWPDDMPEEEQERLRELCNEEGYYDVLENQEGWSSYESEMWLVGPLVLEDADGNIVGDGDSQELDEDE